MYGWGVKFTHGCFLRKKGGHPKRERLANTFGSHHVRHILSNTELTTEALHK